MKYLARITGQTIIVAAVAISLSGCGSTDSDDSYCETQYSTTSVEIGASELLLEPAQNMYVTFPQIESIYLDVEACMGVVAPGPTVIYTSFSECVEVSGERVTPINCEGLGGNLGQYSIGIELVLMNTDEHIFNRNCVTDRDVLKHELVHHLLVPLGVSIEDNTTHNSPFFGLCVS